MPGAAARAAAMPVDGVGLMRAEFLALACGKHPGLLLEEGGEGAFVDLYREGLIEVAATFDPRPVVFRLSDLKSNEYRGLLGGDRFEPVEENPMLGRRGAFRYLAQPEQFALELRAVREARAGGLQNIELMIPFARTVRELVSVRRMIAAELGEGEPKVWAMAEVPSVALLPEPFAAEVDGLSIGSNDLTQLVLGVDRDSPGLGESYADDDEAVREAISRLIAGAHAVGKPISICGERPSSDPGFVEFLVRAGIDSISVVPDAVASTSSLLDELC